MTADDTVHSIRAFNRMYLSAMNLLGNHYLGSDYSIPEMRVLFEIYENRGCSAADIAKSAGIDKGYLSRMIKKLEKQGFVRRESSKSDSRSYRLYLTEEGTAHTQEYIRRSDEEVGKVISPLTEEERTRFLDAITTVQELLNVIKTRRSESSNE